MWTTSFTRILISLFTFVCFISFDVAANGSASNNDPDTIANYSNGNFIAETANNTSAIVGGVIGCILGLAAIAASVVFIFYFKRRSSQPRSRLSSPLVELDKKAQDYILEHRPIKILEFKEQVKRLHKDSNLLFQDDFEDIKKLSSRLPYTSNDAKKEGNKAKNRYSNILPYDHSRVKLLFQMEDDETMDYINANYIPGYNSVREYIATQGPLKSTLSDFWRMLWEQNSHVIVMLSDLYENQKPKVELYWPENLGEPTRYDNFTVELTNFSQFNSIIIRTFRISKGTEVRKVVHFFIVWSDFDADLEVRDFLDLVQVVRMEASTKKSGPIIVHCSAGVGRTGTFIALDYFMQYIEKHSLQDSIDVFSYVMKMRNNRVSMVQAEVQYIFIHDVLVEVIDKKIKLEEGQMNQHIYYNDDDHAKNDETVYVNMNELTNMKTGQENKAYEHDNDKDEESINV
uniref:protein-tyrosine-phosphatase n=1 Tax=Biomphalaria glabrata TaxID=6526 RepID=A0A182Z141_BIOGL